MYLVLQEGTLTGWGNLTVGGREGCPEEVTLELLFEVRGSEVWGRGGGGVPGTAISLYIGLWQKGVLGQESGLRRRKGGRGQSHRTL